MKKQLVVMMMARPTSCSSGGENKSYYQFPIVQDGAQSSTNQGSRLLWVGQITIPDYLAGGRVVYQTSNAQYMIINNDLRASPLDQRLCNALVTSLSMQLPGWVVTSQPLGGTQSILSVTVTGFHDRYDGKIIISGEWLLNHQGQLIKRPFHTEIVWAKDDYNEMVKVLTSAWSQEATTTARELKRTLQA